jgi:glycosyltransferase involved in cell wall biosynthesis
MKAAAFLEVAIPSMGRAGKMKTSAVLCSATVYVPAREVAAYRQASPGVTIAAVPDAIRGITATRNWILNHCRARWLVFVDDDLADQGWFHLKHRKGKRRNLTEGTWMREWTRLASMAEDLGYRIFGVGTDGALRSVYPWRPFIFHTYVTASCMGIRVGGGLRFDEAFKVKEDYELCLRAIKEDGGVLGARYLFWRNAHWKDKGGCNAYRTQEMEEAATMALMRLYPGMIRSVTRGGSGYSIALEF